MSAAGDAEQGLFQRLTTDTTLAALLGSGVRVFATWPDDTLQASDFPRVSFYGFGPPPRATGHQRFRGTLDEWVWASGAQGGRGRLLAIDARVVERFDQAHWAFGGSRLYSTVGGFRDSPGAAGGRMRRTREIIIEASPL